MSRMTLKTEKLFIDRGRPVKPKWKQARDRQAALDLVRFLIGIAGVAFALTAIRAFVPTVVSFLRSLSS